MCIVHGIWLYTYTIYDLTANKEYKEYKKQGRNVRKNTHCPPTGRLNN